MKVKSPYLYEYRDENGKYNVYSTLGNDYLWAEGEEGVLLEDNINHPERYEEDSPLQQYLFDKKYLLDGEISILQYAERIYREKVSPHDVFHIIIMPTEKCNFRCVYCYENFQKGRMSAEAQESLISCVKKKMTEYAALRVEWFGGEPLLEPEIIEHLSSEFINICHNQKKPYVASMTTNGYLLTWPMYLRMKKCHVTSYQITIDGVREAHDTTRVLANGGPTYDVIVNNLMTIKEKEKTPLLSVLIRTNYTKYSAETAEEWMQQVQEMFLSDPRFTFSKHVASNFKQDSSIPDIYLDSNYGRRVVSDDKYPETAYSEMQYAYADNHLCYAMKENSIVVGADGQLYKCTVNLFDEKNHVGKIGKESKEFSYNTQYSHWVFPFGGPEKFLHCVNCPHYPACLGVSCSQKTPMLLLDSCNAIVQSYVDRLKHISQLTDTAHSVKSLLPKESGRSYFC